MSGWTTMRSVGEKGVVKVRTRVLDKHSGLLLLFPTLVMLLLFFILPLVQILIRSLTDPSLGLGNYVALFTDGITLKVLARTLTVAMIVALLTAILGFPYTYVMCHVTPTVRAIMFTVVLIPFWTSMLARNYAWYILMQRDGLFERVFSAVGIDGVVLLGTATGVAIVMAGVMLPFMVLPMYSVMQQLDPKLMYASQNLGASRKSTFWRVYLPLSMPGIIAGGSLVFILALGFFITPALIGSPQNSLIAQLMAIRIQTLLAFGSAGAMGVLILVVTLVVLTGGQRLSGKGLGALSRADAPGGSRAVEGGCES